MGTARVPDLCAGYDLPTSIGETDGAMLTGCFISLNSGYFAAVSMYSALLVGSVYGVPTLINYDSEMEETTKKQLTPTGSSDFSEVRGCTGDAANNKVMLMTNGDTYVGFYEEGVNPTLFTLNYGGFAYSDFSQGLDGVGNGMAYKNGIGFLWMKHTSGNTGGHLFKIRETGVVDFVFQEVESSNWWYSPFNMIVDWTNQFLLNSSLTYPGYFLGQTTACYDFSGAGVNLWLYAEEVYFSYFNTHSDYNNFLYFQCGLDTWLYDLQFLILKLNTVSPYNIINYDLTWTDTDG